MHAFYNQGSTRIVPALDALKYLCRVVDAVEEDKLGFTLDEIRTYLIRLGAAIAMFLDNMPVFLTILVGCWKSNGFLKHIRKQVLETCKGIFIRMLKNDLHYALLSPP